MSDPVNISDCNFIGVQHTEHTVEAIKTIAEALLENAQALHCLARCCSGPTKALLNIERHEQDGKDNKPDE
jgi:hypothetical protein